MSNTKTAKNSKIVVPALGRNFGPFTKRLVGLQVGQKFVEKEKSRATAGSLIHRAKTHIFDGKRAPTRAFSTHVKKNGNVEVQRVA